MPPRAASRSALLVAGLAWGIVAGLVVLYAGWVRAPLPALAHVYWKIVPPWSLIVAGWLLAGIVSIAPVDDGPGPADRDGQRREVRRFIAMALWIALLVVFHDRKQALGDSEALLHDPVRKIQTGGWYTYFDELLGMWLPLRLARVFFVVGGYTPQQAIFAAYRIISVGAGAMFFAVALRWVRTLPAPRFALALVLTAAHSLLFAGYLENYVLSSLLLTAGFALAVQHLTADTLDARAITATTICFTAAVAFHAVSVWSVLSLVYLAALSGSFVRTAARNAGIAALMLVPVALLFEYVITPGVGFAHVHQGSIVAGFVDTLRTRTLAIHAHFLLRGSLASLVGIALSFLAAPRATWQRLQRRDARFALLYFAGFFIHQLIWKTTIGYERDWDLFGYTWLPLVYLAIILVPPSLALRGALVVLQLLAGFTWLLAQATTRSGAGS